MLYHCDQHKRNIGTFCGQFGETECEIFEFTLKSLTLDLQTLVFGHTFENFFLNFFLFCLKRKICEAEVSIFIRNGCDITEISVEMCLWGYSQMSDVSLFYSWIKCRCMIISFRMNLRFAQREKDSRSSWLSCSVLQVCVFFSISPLALLLPRLVHTAHSPHTSAIGWSSQLHLTDYCSTCQFAASH